MKTSNIQNALLGIDENYLDKSFDFQGLSYDFKKAKQRKIRCAVAAVCCMAVCVTALGVNKFGIKNDISPIDSEHGAISNTEIYSEPSWESQDITEKFPAIIFNNAVYNYTAKDRKSVSITQKTDKEIGTQVMTETDYATGKKHHINADIYSMENISTDCAIALKFEGYDGTFAYINTDFHCATLGDLISALDLNNTLTFGDIEYKNASDNKHQTFYKINNQADVRKHLLSHTDAEDLGDNYIKPLFDISVNVPSLCISNMALIVSEDGYIQTNILQSAHTFYIGKEAVESFKSYVMTLPSRTVPIDTSDEILTCE